MERIGIKVTIDGKLLEGTTFVIIFDLYFFWTSAQMQSILMYYTKYIIGEIARGKRNKKAI